MQPIEGHGRIGYWLTITPIDVNNKISINDRQKLESEGIRKYRYIVEKLIYLTLVRPDIIYIVNTVSQFMYTPMDIHI